MVKKSLNIIFLFLIHSSLYSQIFQPTSSLLLEKNNIKESSISLKIKTEQIIFKSLDIDELKIQIKRNNIDVENQIAILQNSITNVMMDKQELLKLIDIKKMQEQIEIKKQSRKDIEQQMQKDLSNLTFQGLYLVLLNDIDMWASKGKLSNRAEKLLAPIAIEDLNGVFISSLTVIKNKKLLTDDISSQVSGQMTIEKQYISKTIDNRSKFIYLIKVNVASLKKSNILKDNSNDLPENYLVINLLSDNDYKTKLQNQGISDDDIKATEFEVNLGKIAIDGTNSTSSRRQQKIIRTGFSNIAKIDDDIALLEEKLANQGSYLKQTIESLTTVIYDDNDMESSINKAMQYFDDQVEELEQQLLDVKEKELVAKYAVNVTTEGNPADDIAKTAFNVYKQIKQSYSKIEQFIHETKVSNSILVSDISGNAQDIFRDVEKIWLYPVAGDNDNFVLTVVAQFKIPHRKKSSRTSYINDSEKLGDMVYVAGGTFLMGSKEFYDETPVHRVVLDAFYIDKYEVTNKQFCEFLNAKRRHATNNALWLDISNKDSKIVIYDKKYVTEMGYANHPVTMVSWFGAKEYAKWAGKRLPTEAEWEYAAGGGNKSKHFKYSGSDHLNDVAWYNKNSRRATHPIGKKQPNELDLYDMSGNVLEWCSDWYSRSYYKRSPINNPTGPSSGDHRVLRGASWKDKSEEIHYKNRYAFSPGSCYNTVGFRCAK